MFTYHLVKTSLFNSIYSMVNQLNTKHIPGLVHGECMNTMTLGSPIFSPSRILFNRLAVFAQWENEEAVNHFLENHRLGKILAKGWHVRMIFLRKWGKFHSFQIPEDNPSLDLPNEVVVAVTLAKMKFLQIPRFIHWGRPVEKLVRDHPDKTLALASIKFPNMVSTFSIWNSQKSMTDMVFGHSKIPSPTRHIDAMKEREKKDFHFEFTTLRFKPIAEYGQWNGQTNFTKLHS